MSYTSLSKKDIKIMLDKLGCKNIESFFAFIPKDLLHKNDFNLEPSISEFDISTIMKELADSNNVNDNIYFTGETMGSLDGNTVIGDIDVFLIKYNSSGTKQWTKQFGTGSTDRGVSVATDNCSSVYVTGQTSGDLEGTHSGYTNCGGICPDMFLIKFNSAGVLQ